MACTAARQRSAPVPGRSKVERRLALPDSGTAVRADVAAAEDGRTPGLLRLVCDTAALRGRDALARRERGIWIRLPSGMACTAARQRSAPVPGRSKVERRLALPDSGTAVRADVAAAEDGRTPGLLRLVCDTAALRGRDALARRERGIYAASTWSAQGGCERCGTCER